MNSVHLGAGSEKPEDVKGQARLYNMKYCPFAHLVRLVLSLKKIPYNIVNINVRNKPEWYFQIHPEGKVPAFVDTDGSIITDSTIIINYLNNKYPEPLLYNEATKSRDLQLQTNYEKVVRIFAKCMHRRDDRPFKIIRDEISNIMQEFEEELKQRGTAFFNGSQPGMLDIYMWPWAERAKALCVIYNEPPNFDNGKFPHIMKWIAAMKSQPFVQENAVSYQKYAQVIQTLNAGETVDYDNI